MTAGRISEGTAVYPPKAGRLPDALRPARMIRLKMQAAQVLADSQLVLKIVAFGTLFMVTVLTLLLSLSMFAFGNGYVFPRLVVLLAILGYVGAIILLIRRRRVRSATVMLLAFYALLGTAISLIWGINVPAGVLILSFVVILAGTLLGARWIIPVTAVILGLLTLVQIATDSGLVHPDTDSLALPSNFLDVGSYAAIFVVIAVVSWLSGRRMEQSLAKALAAETALQAEKDLLAVRLDERTRSLREAQLEETRQLYRFAELGQLSTVVLHDLSNNLTALTLDIDDIGQQSRRSDAVDRARESIAYLDGMIAQARRQLRETDAPETFDAAAHVRESVAGLAVKARRSGVRLALHSTLTSELMISGDPLRFAQILTILVSNAVESYAPVTAGKGEPVVDVTVNRDGRDLRIEVTDRGAGLDAARRAVLFEPFHSTKPNGMGIGLFIAREIVVRHFKGSIVLDPSFTVTRFVVRIPEQHDARR